MTDAVNIMERKVKSEHNSPILGPQAFPVHPSIRDLSLLNYDPSAYSYSPFGTESPTTQNNSLQGSQNASQQDLTLPERFPDTWFMTYEQAHDYEPPPMNYNDVASVDWSTYNLETGSNSYTPPNKDNSPFLAQQPAYTPVELSNQINRIGITSSSGEPSEAEEQSPPTRWGNERQTGTEAFNDFSSPGDDTSDKYRLSSASSFYGTPQANMLASDGLGTMDIDDYLKQAEAETARMKLQNQLAQMQMAPQDPQHQSQPPSRLSSISRGITPTTSTPGSTATGEHSYTVREAQRYAHMEGPSPESMFQQKSAMPTSAIVDDPSWSAAPDMSDPDLVLNDERDDEDWVR